MKFILSLAITFVLLMQIGLLTSCDSQQIDDQIPFVSFTDIRINLKSQQYLALQNQGYITIDGGIRGIIVHKTTFGDEYTAFERNCSYQPNNACALVEVAASGLSMQDLCCNSTFEFNQGNPTGGPAQSPLRRYRTIVNGDVLTIVDEPLN